MMFAIMIIEPSGSKRWYTAQSKLREEFPTYSRAVKVAVRLTLAGGLNKYEVVEINVG
jgi:hypothetical protein